MSVGRLFLFFLATVATAALAQEKTHDEYPAHTLDDVVALLAQHPSGVKVTVDFPIAKVDFVTRGARAGHVFLDSMDNYRDPRSVNVNVFPHSARRLKLSPDATLAGKTIAVQGLAKRVRINCHYGCPQDPKASYYFQTQIFVREGDDAQIDETKGE